MEYEDNSGMGGNVDEYVAVCQRLEQKFLASPSPSLFNLPSSLSSRLHNSKRSVVACVRDGWMRGARKTPQTAFGEEEEKRGA
eukprot:3219887-Rhodomonas_salina.2